MSLIVTVLFSVFILPINEAIAFQLPLYDTKQFVLAGIMKLLFAVTFFLAFYYALFFVQKIISKDRFYIEWLKIAGIYLIINVALFILVYPGFWMWDELYVQSLAKEYSLVAWQHIFTNIYHTLCLYLIPTGIGVVIIQILGSSFAVGYLTTKIGALLTKKYWLKWIVFALFLTIPILVNNLYPLRLTAYSYIELIVLFRVLLLLLNKAVSNKPIIEFSVLSTAIVLLMFWRTEGIFLIILLPILAVKLGIYKRANIRKISTWAATLYILGILGLSQFATNYTSDPKYQLTAIFNPLAVMVANDATSPNIEKDYQVIENFKNIEEIKKFASASSLDALWSGSSLKEGYEHHLDELKMVYLDLIIHNPLKFLEARWETFIATNALTDDPTQVGRGVRFADRAPGEIKDGYTRFYEENLFSQPLNFDLKLFITEKLLFLTPTNEHTESGARKINEFARYVWTVLPTLLLLSALGIITLIKKEWPWLLMVAIEFMRSGLIFITAPDNFFMYYFPIYMTGSFIVLLYIIFKIDTHAKKARTKKKIS